MENEVFKFFLLGVIQFFLWAFLLKKVKKKCLEQRRFLFLRHFVRGEIGIAEPVFTFLLTAIVSLAFYDLRFAALAMVSIIASGFVYFKFRFVNFYLGTLFQMVLFLRSLEQLQSTGLSYLASLSQTRKLRPHFLLRHIFNKSCSKRKGFLSFLTFLFSLAQDAAARGLSVRRILSHYADYLNRLLEIEREQIDLVRQATFQALFAFFLPWGLWALLFFSNPEFRQAMESTFLTLFFPTVIWNAIGLWCIREKLKFLTQQ